MKLTVKINKLFDSFNYDLTFDKQISILTSPNGFGKTTILKMLYYLSTQNFNKLIEIEFSNFEIIFNDNTFLIEKTLENNDYFLSCSCNGQNILKFTNQDFETRARALGYTRKPRDNNRWTNLKWLHLENQIPSIPESEVRNAVYSKDSNLKDFWDKLPKILSISANRLIDFDDDGQIINPSYPQYIDKINKRFKWLIHFIIDEYSNKSQIVDSKFIDQVINFSEDPLDKDEYENKILIIKQKSSLISKYKLLPPVEDNSIPKYNEKNIEVFTIYVNNWLNKLSIFDDLVDKFELFTKIINKKKLVNKNIFIEKVNKIIFIEKGSASIKFKRNDGKPLPLEDLSHGEQHLLILLYELLFNRLEYDFVLIDEPEIGLHISWQLEFIEDLKKILEISKMSSIVATHSPQIINDNWEYVLDLSEFYGKE